MCGAARRKHERRKVWAASGARRREKPGVVWRGQRAGHTRAAVLRSQREAAKAESAKHVCASRTCTQAQPCGMGTPSRNRKLAARPTWPSKGRSQPRCPGAGSGHCCRMERPASELTRATRKRTGGGRPCATVTACTRRRSDRAYRSRRSGSAVGGVC